LYVPSFKSPPASFSAGFAASEELAVELELDAASLSLFPPQAAKASVENATTANPDTIFFHFHE
jgi:hypothetical protein